MKFVRLFPFFLLLTTLFFVTSCSEDGDDGSVGPAGTQGEKGDKGDQGDKGDPGNGGDASVVYSTWMDLIYKEDKLDDKILGYYINVDAPRITRDILHSGDVRVYVNTGNRDEPLIKSVPYIASSGLRIDVTAMEGTIGFYSNSNVSTYARDGYKYLQYRYVLIPGSMEARKAQNINWDNYTEVKAALNLPD